MDQYDHKEIEKKWQKRWADDGLYIAEDHSDKPKQYVLDMFPYPSGEGLHVGHPKGYVATDVYSRFKRMSGFNVLHPMGWDAFGLPAENFAIKNKVHPRVAVEKNIAYFKQQLSNIGFSYDWSREINTTDPAFYKWTQWIFLKLFEKGLAFESNEPINWCPSCQTGLANEDVNSDGTCERCDTKVEKKLMRQWVLKITDYADRMLEDLDTLTEWPEHVKESQRNWIGKSEGAEIEFQIVNSDKKIKVFTTRPDTLYGATYVVLAPEHGLIQGLIQGLENKEEINTYIKEATQKNEIERTSLGKEKTGVELKGIKAINPGNKEEIPVFVADYVLNSYGTGAIMAVPAHDERDYGFATKYNLPIKHVVAERFILDGVLAERNGVETLERRVVDAIIRDQEGNFYLIKEGEGHVHLVGGGLEDKENELEAVHREVLEESGFTDFEVTKRVSTYLACWAFRHIKNKNQRTVGPAYEVILNSLEKQDSEVEEGHHELIKVSPKEVLNLITWPHHRSFVKQYLEQQQQTYTGDGILLDSDEFSNLTNEEAKKKITKYVGGKITSTYRLQDWVFSRQRYWGEPIPVIHCEKCGVVPVPEDQLPVILPEVDQYEPTGTGESPLAAINEWVNVECPKCDSPAKRETNTMPQWAGSSWYWLRFMDPHNEKEAFSEKSEKYWGPVDVYVGGDHAVRHLIYARFWHKFLYDIGAVSSIEPFTRLEFLGFILAEDGKKMSKRSGNIINPDEVIDVHGADAFRVFEMFMGPFENTVPWSTNGIIGAQRFIERVWRLQNKVVDDSITEVENALHQTIKKVSEDIQIFKFNTAVSAMMIFVNEVEKVGSIGRDQYKDFLTILAPFAPHITEELWNKLGHSTSIHLKDWPEYDPEKAIAEAVVISVQIAGKMRGTVTVGRDADQVEVEKKVHADSKLVKYLDFKPSKVIFVPNKVINFLT